MERSATKISVVTAVYNRADTIGQAIDSVRRQSHPSVEHVVQDGGSTDGTLDEIANRASDDMHLVSEKDDGLYDAINRGITRATGDVIGLMHSDDYFASNDVLSWVNNALRDPNIDGVYGDLDYVSASDPAQIVRKWRSGPYTPASLRQGWMPPHPTLYLRRAVFDQWGLYDTQFRISADYDAMLRFLGQGKIRLAYVPEVFVKMRVGGESNKSLLKIIRKSHEDWQAIRRNGTGGAGTLLRKNVSKIGQFFS